MRTIAMSICWMAFTCSCMGDWTPPDKPDPQKIMQEAKSDAQAGNYRDALAKQIWFHENALQIQPSLSGVRLSFALSNWLELGEKYPAALAKMKQVRDDLEERIRDKDKVRVRFEDFHEFVAFNRILRDDERTDALFRWLDETDEEDAERVFDVAMPSLIKHKRYELCGKYIDPERNSKQYADMYKMSIKLANSTFGEQHREYASKSYLNQVSTLVALLVLNERTEEATKIADEAKKVVEPELKKKLEAQLGTALKGTVPKPWP